MIAGIAEWAMGKQQEAAAVLDSMESKQTWKEYAGRTTGPEGYSVGDITRHMAKKTKESVVDSIKHKILRVMQQTYVDRVKPQLTADDKAMPMFVRRAIHELADEFFTLSWWKRMWRASVAKLSNGYMRTPFLTVYMHDSQMAVPSDAESQEF